MIPGMMSSLPIYYNDEDISRPVREYLDSIDPASQNRSPATTANKAGMKPNITGEGALARARAIGKLTDLKREALRRTR